MAQGFAIEWQRVGGCMKVSRDLGVGIDGVEIQVEGLW